MATIGLDKLYYAKITEDASGIETYGTPKVLAKAMSANLSVEIAEAMLYADDAASETVKNFRNGTISLGVDDLVSGVAEDLTGASVDANGVLVSATEDISVPVAIGFRAAKSNGKYRYFWLYRVVFSIPATVLATKGDSITFNTPTIEGTIMRRNKPDARGRHPWKTEVTEGATGVSQSVINGWYTAVYEPSFNVPDATLSALTIGSLSLSPTFAPGTLYYTASTTAASAAVTATATDDDASVVIIANGETIESGDTVTWVSGENVVLAVVTNGDAVKIYTVTVTKGA